jgi:hypothetical protein
MRRRPINGAGLWTRSVPRIWRCAPEGATFLFWAPRALANRHRVGRREARASDMPRLPASHAPLAAASFAGAVLAWRRRNALDLHAISCQACLLALQRGGREKSSLISTPFCLGHLAHLGPREHTVPREFGIYLSVIAEECGFGRNQPVCELSGSALIRRQLTSLYHFVITLDSFG